MAVVTGQIAPMREASTDAAADLLNFAGRARYRTILADPPNAAAD